MTTARLMAQVATRAANLADRDELAGAPEVASLLREVADEVEAAIIRVTPPPLPGWLLRL